VISRDSVSRSEGYKEYKLVIQCTLTGAVTTDDANYGKGPYLKRMKHKVSTDDKGSYNCIHSLGSYNNKSQGNSILCWSHNLVLRSKN
jgi:hypothetical protein